jgi:hypothetical protein
MNVLGATPSERVKDVVDIHLQKSPHGQSDRSRSGDAGLAVHHELLHPAVSKPVREFGDAGRMLIVEEQVLAAAWMADVVELEAQSPAAKR